jgi:urease accessory protein
MNDLHAPLTPESPLAPAAACPDSGWPAALALHFGRDGTRSVLTGRRHSGPLRVQKALYPEGAEVCHAIVVHPPGGIVPGDRLEIAVDVDAQAHAVLTTPGAGKWYRSDGRDASQQIIIKVGAGGTAEWLPQESILFDGARARLQTAVDLAPDACFVGLETLCFGRRASGEQFARGQLRLATEIRLGTQLIWRERGVIDGGSPLLTSPIGLAGHSVSSTLLLAGPDIDDATLGGARAIGPEETGAQCALTRLPHLLVGRYLGDSPEAARAWFLSLWSLLRPACVGRAAATPRIWAT